MPVTVELVYNRDRRTYYRCSRASGKDVEVVHQDWYQSTIDYQGGTYDCWAYTGKSGTIYYTWALDVKGKGKKGRD
jgi:hypothetical protein